MTNTIEPKAVEALNRMLLSTRFSLAIYVRDGHLWTHHGDEPLLKLIGQIADEHDRFAMCLTEYLGRRVGKVPHGHFPTDFTRLDEVALDYVLPELIVEQRRMIEQIEEGVLDLESTVRAKRLAEDLLIAERGNLEKLIELEQTMAREEWMA
jgi:hypothetical protein